jgi:hypothetical protein
LRHVGALVEKQLPKLFLAPDGARPDDFENGFLALAFVRHAVMSRADVTEKP